MNSANPAALRPWHEIVRTSEAPRREARHLCAGQRARAADRSFHADPFFTTFATSREEEALGIIAGAWMGGRRGILLMQTSGFATLPNVARLAVGAVPDPGADDGLRTRHAGRVQHRPGNWWPAPCARCWIRWRSSTTR